MDSNNSKGKELMYPELQKLIEDLELSNKELTASVHRLENINSSLRSELAKSSTLDAELGETLKKLDWSKTEISNLLSNTKIATLFLNVNFNITKFTPTIKKLFNHQNFDLGSPLTVFASNFDEKVRHSMVNDCHTALNELVVTEKEIQDKDGNYFFERISPFITDDKKIDGVVITFVNISNLKKIQKELSITESRYINLFKNINEGLAHGKVFTNESGQVIDWEYISVNPAFEKYTGQLASVFIGKRISEIWPKLKKDSVDWLKVFGETALENKEHFIEYYSTELKKHLMVHVFCPKHGEFAATYADVTKMKEMILLSNRDKLLLEASQSIAKVGGWELDLLSGELFWTKETYYLQDTNPEEFNPTVDAGVNLFLPESKARITEALKAATEQGIGYDLELETYTTKGRRIDVRTTCDVTMKNGKPVKLTGIFQDITKAKETKKELIIAKEKAESSNKHKNYFLANMSHEIRTPMNGIIGFAELLKNGKLSPEKRTKYLDVIEGNSKQLMALIDDIIDVSKIDSNELRISMNQFRPSVLLDDLKENFDQIKLKYKNKDVSFQIDIDESLKDLVIETDRLRMSQLMSNLLNNSLKFSDKGIILMGYRIKDDQIQFYVKDEGIGIAEDKLPEIFGRFKQVNYDKAAVYGGNGLGLAICRGISHLLGGDISVESKLNEGSTFSVTIPLKIVKKADKNVKEKGNRTKVEDLLSIKTILIAEDDAINQLYLKEVFKILNTPVIFAENGKVAVDLFAKNKRIDAVLMDLRMPEMNGFEAAESILKIDPSAVIIAQTAFTSLDEKEKCINLGFADYLTKPVSKKAIASSLAKHLKLG